MRFTIRKTPKHENKPMVEPFLEVRQCIVRAALYMQVSMETFQHCLASKHLLDKKEIDALNIGTKCDDVT